MSDNKNGFKSVLEESMNEEGTYIITDGGGSYDCIIILNGEQESLSRGGLTHVDVVMFKEFTTLEKGNIDG